MLLQKKKTAEPNRKLISLLLQQDHVPCDDDALPKTRVSASARCSFPWNTRWLAHARVPAPLRRTKNEGDDARRILAQYTYTMTSAPFLEICSLCRSVLRLDVRFVVLALARFVEFRWKTVETVTSWHL